MRADGGGVPATAGITATAFSGNRRSVRQHALLQDSFRETQQARRTGVQGVKFGGLPRWDWKSYSGKFLTGKRSRRQGQCLRDRFDYDCPDFLAAGNLRRRLFLLLRGRSGVHGAFVCWRHRIGRRFSRPEKTVVRKNEPGREREQHCGASACSAKRGANRHLRLIAHRPGMCHLFFGTGSCPLSVALPWRSSNDRAW